MVQPLKLLVGTLAATTAVQSLAVPPAPAQPADGQPLAGSTRRLADEGAMRPRADAPASRGNTVSPAVAIGMPVLGAFGSVAAGVAGMVIGAKLCERMPTVCGIAGGVAAAATVAAGTAADILHTLGDEGATARAVCATAAAGIPAAAAALGKLATHCTALPQEDDTLGFRWIGAAVGALEGGLAAAAVCADKLNPQEPAQAQKLGFGAGAMVMGWAATLVGQRVGELVYAWLQPGPETYRRRTFQAAGVVLINTVTATIAVAGDQYINDHKKKSSPAAPAA